MEVLTLRDAKIGESYRVKRISGQGAVKRRIMDMGLTKNAGFTVVKVAPLGDPVQIHLRGYQLSLRKQDAEMVQIEPIDASEIEDN
ncbi:MAG: ferrous iron transport protein A [Peptoniphilus sp. oral taxon 375]|uniref:Ferrous iron transport protein A n=1 Tax=Urinicoccus massiliensis TaxID=1723382 RepID=A0A8H2QTK2_9FIRM|nr:FeoA family protein [Urinicoccus massiliensis]KGF09882.1 iron transporter FeoA [Tissierellia bacterium S5-A11]MBS4871831.1 ferrous iron transport protein A [Peptoniphilus sp. oral taxon 375]VFB16990.1 Ferrous iron transport protein A [Urinicoccus massiliensis]